MKLILAVMCLGFLAIWFTSPSTSSVSVVEKTVAQASTSPLRALGGYGVITKFRRYIPNLFYVFALYDFYDVVTEKNEEVKREKILHKSVEYTFCYAGSALGAAIGTAILPTYGTIIGGVAGGMYFHSFLSG